MDNTELLQAIGQMMDERFAAERKHTAQMMDEKLESTKNELRQDMTAQEKRTDEKFSSLRQEMAAQEKRTDEKFRSLEQQINGIDMRLGKDFKEIKGLLKDDYGRVEQNAAKGAAAADRCKEMGSTQADHTRALQNHNERITVLEEKAI